MSIGSNSNILALTNTQAKDLAGTSLTIAGECYRFKDYAPAYPGQPPWRSGAEGKAYPLVGHDGGVAAYLKFFTRPTQQRFERTAWLIGLEMHTWLPGLAAAPLLWADTRQAHHSAEIPFDFAGYLARAVPGETWLELKNHITEAGIAFPEDLRWRSASDLIRALAVLEQADIVHGDLSPNNIVIDLEAQPDEPALYLIDFDAFVAPAAGPNRAITLADGGTYGTEGYCPPDLAARAGSGDGSAAPYSDRFGRDMLLVELLFMDRALSADDPPSRWDHERLRRRYAAWRARCDPACCQTLAHLEPSTVFSLAEHQRPSSAELAAALGISLPAMPATSPAGGLRHSAAAIPGPRPPAARVKRVKQTPAPAKGQIRSRWSPSVRGQKPRRGWAAQPSSADDDRSTQGCGFFLLLCGVISLLHGGLGVILGASIDDPIAIVLGVVWLICIIMAAVLTHVFFGDG